MKSPSLAEFLGVLPVEECGPDDLPSVQTLVDISDPQAFCRGILQSKEFRQYILNGVTLGDLPPAVVTRIMDHGWGKPLERVEHTGKDGGPVITEVRRIIVQAPRDVFDQLDAAAAAADDSPTRTH